MAVPTERPTDRDRARAPGAERATVQPTSTQRIIISPLGLSLISPREKQMTPSFFTMVGNRSGFGKDQRSIDGERSV